MSTVDMTLQVFSDMTKTVYENGTKSQIPYELVKQVRLNFPLTNQSFKQYVTIYHKVYLR